MTEPRTIEEMRQRYAESRARIYAAGDAFQRQRTGRLIPSRIVKPANGEAAERTDGPPPAQFAEALDLAARHRIEKMSNRGLEVLADDFKLRRIPTTPNFVRITAEVAAQAHGVPVFLLFGQTRIRPAVDARQECWRLLADSRRYSLPQIGRWFGRDHTTVLHGVRKARARAHVQAVTTGGHDGRQRQTEIEQAQG